MATEVSICNLALSWLAGNLIISLNDETVEAQLCNANYISSRDAVLEDRAWTFATQRYRWTPLSESPVYGYGYAFMIEPEVIRVLEVRDNDDPYNPNGANSLDWRRESNAILANASVIYVKALRRVVDTSKYPPSFVMALAARLAADICIPLTESRQMQQDMWNLYMKKLDDAMATDGMQGSTDIIESRKLTGIR
jgi:hypothetical protein